jgi:DDE superfamily endonuclease/Helix-turn-helix of DDE superfamily endonuclease
LHLLQVLLYTSLELDVFCILVRLLERLQPFNYYGGFKVTCLSLEDQLLMCLMKLRLNFRDMDLAVRFNVSKTTVSNIVKTFISVLHEILFVGLMSTMPSLSKCQGSMPKCFHEFPSCRCVIDATEVTVDIPSDMNKQSLCYSHYKSRHTVKVLTGVAPNGTIVFCSSAYPGSTSDTKITGHCGFVNQLKAGDLILADKGFTIQSLLPKDVSLNIPPFLRGKAQFSPEEAQICRKIAKARIHIERANERIKNFTILSHITHKYRCFVDKIIQVCCALVNFQSPLLQEINDAHEPMLHYCGSSIVID